LNALTRILAAAGVLLLSSVAIGETAVSPPSFSLSIPTLAANKPFIIAAMRSSSLAAPVARIYVTQWDGHAGSTQVVTGKVAVPPPSTEVMTTFWRVDFQLRLPAGTYDVGYYESEAPDPHRPADVQFQIVVTSHGFVDVVEYVNVDNGHFFLTADETEIRNLDTGVIAGWRRTEEAFGAIPPAQTIGMKPVCRLYGLPQDGVDTHFYSDDPGECASVPQKWPDRWVTETDRAFGFLFPYLCEDPDYGTGVPLYRLYNARPDTNHRYTTSVAVRDAMLAQGWILEGGQYGNAFACVPSS